MKYIKDSSGYEKLSKCIITFFFNLYTSFYPFHLEKLSEISFKVQGFSLCEPQKQKKNGLNQIIGI